MSREVGRVCCIYGMSPAVEAVQKKIRERRARELSKPRDKSIYFDVRSELIQVATKERAAVAQGLRDVQTENTYPNDGGKRGRHASKCSFPTNDTDELARKRVEMTSGESRVGELSFEVGRKQWEESKAGRAGGRRQEQRRRCWMVSLQVQVNVDSTRGGVVGVVVDGVENPQGTKEEQRELDVSRGRQEETMMNGSTPWLALVPQASNVPQNELDEEQKRRRP